MQPPVVAPVAYFASAQAGIFLPLTANRLCHQATDVSALLIICSTSFCVETFTHCTA